MTPTLTMRRIVLPQAMRVIIPPTGNEFISMLKTSSLASVDHRTASCCGGPATSTRRNLEIMPLLVVASIWYLVLTSVASIGQYYLERRFARAAAQPDRDGAAAARRTSCSSGRGYDARWSRPRACTSASAASRCCAGIDLEVEPRRGDGDHRAVGFGQVDVPALHQPPREDQRRAALGRRRARRLPARRATRSTSCASARSRASAAEIGMVFQHFNLFPHMTALENVIEAPMQVQGEHARGARRARAWQLLDRVGLADKARRLPGAAVGRPAAAGRDRAGAGDGAAS